MKRFSILITVVLLGICSLSAQENNNLIDNDKSNYEQNVFNKAFDDQNDSLNSIQKLYDKIPAVLPNWVLTPVDGNRIVGFSDPNMDKEEAFKQAVERAKALYALLNSSVVSNITDDYTNLKESGKYSLYTTKFQDFSLSKAKIAYNNASVQIIDTFYTKFNEGIALIEFNNENPEKKDTLIIKGEHLQVFIEKNFKKEKIVFYNFSIDDNLENDSSDILAQYNYKIVNRGYDISSIYGQNTIEFKERTYNYVTDLEFSTDSTDSELNFFRLSRGLWNAYISGVLSNITVLSKQLASQVKNSNDFYTLKNEGLIRTVARNKVEFEVNSFKLYQNQFYIDLNGIIVQ